MDIRIENLSYFCFRKIRWSLRMIMGMKKLLSLPPNLVDCFHAVEHVSTEEWFCTSDPVGARLGSGGGTTWLLEASRRKEAPDVSTEEWLGQEKRILLHAGGQSRRLPGYAPSGKILTPIPVFRWARGQRLSQNLLSLQLPLYERIMKKAPESPLSVWTRYRSKTRFWWCPGRAQILRMRILKRCGRRLRRRISFSYSLR